MSITPAPVTPTTRVPTSQSRVDDRAPANSAKIRASRSPATQPPRPWTGEQRLTRTTLPSDHRPPPHLKREGVSGDQTKRATEPRATEHSPVTVHPAAHHPRTRLPPTEPPWDPAEALARRGHLNSVRSSSELVELLRRRPAWMSDSACRETPTVDFFFPPPSQKKRKAANAVCVCPASEPVKHFETRCQDSF